jgi:hypothetical protein
MLLFISCINKINTEQKGGKKNSLEHFTYILEARPLGRFICPALRHEAIEPWRTVLREG